VGGESLTPTVDKSGHGYPSSRTGCIFEGGEPASQVVFETAANLAKDQCDDREDVGRMGIFKRKVPRHYVPIHPDNITSKDWIVLLEAGTIVGRSAEKLRVALATLERKIVTKYNIFLRKEHFLVLEDYDPRIHALYFCPQLYKLDPDNKPIALDGQEIGKLLAQSVRDGVVEKQPWYEPSATLPREPIIATTAKVNFDSLIVEDSTALKSAA
jgi:hypothetical protein